MLTFDEPTPGMPRARILTPACTAELYLQGAHLTRWQPTGHDPVLFLSEHSALAPGKAIRGGVPIVFPWFGSPQTSPVPAPAEAASHGFARVWPWTLTFAALAGDNLHLSLTLDQTEGIRALGFNNFQLACEIVLGPELVTRLSVANTGDQPFRFEEALHTYLHVGEAAEVSIEGLAHTEFLDKTDEFKRKTQIDAELRFTGETDRPYLNTTAPVSLHDPVLRRTLTVTKTNSQTTVVWNPWSELAARLPDLGDNDWHHFACIETANASENVINLLPSQVHTMQTRLTVSSL